MAVRKRTRDRPRAEGAPATVPPLPVRPNATLAELAREWLKQRDKRTRQADSERLQNHVLPLFGALRPRELSAGHLATMIQETLAKKGMNVKSARNAYAVFSELIGAALARGMLDADPRASLAPDIWPEEPAARPVFSDAEVRALTQDERLPEVQRVYDTLAFHTQLSSRDICELTFGNWRARLGAAPSAEARACVERWRAEGFARAYGRAPAPEDWLVPRAGNAAEPNTEGSAFKAFRRACVALGIKTRSPLAIRNTFEARHGAPPEPSPTAETRGL